VSFVESIPSRITFAVAQGTVHVRCNGLWPDQAININTPSGSGVLPYPGELRVDVLPDQDAAIFTSLANEATLFGAQGFRQVLYAGQALELAGSNPVFPQWLQPTGPDDLDYWSQQRDQQILHAASYQYVSPEIPGADELDANGTWLPGTEYGAIWFPNNVPYGWAPYHYGHWVNHAPWGWVWVEDESWGYAPFHYGRWVNFSGRWGWVPGPPAAHPVWSPAGSRRGLQALVPRQPSLYRPGQYLQHRREPARSRANHLREHRQRHQRHQHHLRQPHHRRHSHAP
jgi:hypothetical protein